MRGIRKCRGNCENISCYDYLMISALIMGALFLIFGGIGFYHNPSWQVALLYIPCCLVIFFAFYKVFIE